MGKRLNQQRRGRGGSLWESPGFRYLGRLSLGSLTPGKGVIVELKRDATHTAPLARIVFDNGEEILIPAFNGAYVGQVIYRGTGEVKPGNILPLDAIPEGTKVYMIELRPGDGGKLVRTAGGFAFILAREGGKVKIKLPSGATKLLDPRCRAVVGEIAGGGLKEKPILKAGKKWHIMHAKHRYWPRVSAASMNAVEHPFGGGRKHRHTGKPETTSRNAPPGRKVGYIAARRTGRKKR